MFIFREESQILCDVDFLYSNERCLRSDTLQHALCFVAERTIRFRVELELHRFGSQFFNYVSQRKPSKHKPRCLTTRYN